MVQDSQDLQACYARALECADLALEGARPASEVVVDFTGGTKVMSAALALATVGRGFTFSYVGGTARTREGRGVVVTGSETIVRRADPFALYLVEERRRLALHFNSYQFAASRDLLTTVLDRTLREPDPVVFSTLRDIARAYEAWERFEYVHATELLGKTMRQWETAVGANSAIPYAGILPTLRVNVSWLEDLLRETRRMQRYAPALVSDMVANAGRRAEEGKYDDAVVRLYRSLELGGQVAVQRRLGCGTDQVPVAHVPPGLRAEFAPRYERQPGVLELPLQATYRLLAALGEPEGRRFTQREEDFKKIQSARNSSWLAHGRTSITKEPYQSLRVLAREILEPKEAPRFVTLPERRGTS